MSELYEIQARLIERRAGMILRDESRRATAGTLDTAIARAHEFVADGMVTWVFTVHPQPGRTAPTYREVAHIRPPRPAESSLRSRRARPDTVACVPPAHRTDQPADQGVDVPS